MRPAASSPIDSYHTYAAQDYMSPMTNDECAPPPPSHDHSEPTPSGCEEAAKSSPMPFGPWTPLPATPTRSRRGDARISPKRNGVPRTNSHPMHIGDKRRHGQSSAEERDRLEHPMERHPADLFKQEPQTHGPSRRGQKHVTNSLQDWQGVM